MAATQAPLGTILEHVEGCPSSALRPSWPSGADAIQAPMDSTPVVGNSSVPYDGTIARNHSSCCKPLAFRHGALLDHGPTAVSAFPMTLQAGRESTVHP